MLCNLSYWLLSYMASWLLGLNLSYWAPELHGSLDLWLFRLPSHRKALTTLMQIYGELGRTTWFPKCPGFLINSGLSWSYFASKLLPLFDRVEVRT